MKMLPKTTIAFGLKPRLWIWMLLAVICFLLIPIWFLLFAEPLKRLPNNFAYSADLLSLDNLYDEKLKKFEGPNISRTTFSYHTLQNEPNYQLIKNIFTVRKLSGDRIFSVDRNYYINPYTSEHVYIPGVTPQKRSGYLFAPRYLDKRDFTYWHINYNSPALMKFIDEEKIHGLTVYHYRANYSADQSPNLTNLPGVPEARGVNTNVALQLWVEPVSGWLVKYQDNSLATYYDRNTRQSLTPWNSFSNRYTENSIKEQVENATQLKWTILTIDIAIPAVLMLLTLLFVWIAYKKAIHANYRVVPARLSDIFERYVFPNIIWFMVAVAILLTALNFYSYKKREHVFTVGISQWSKTTNLQDAIRGFKERLAQYGYHEGKNIRFIMQSPEADFEKQIAIIQYFVESNVDLIFTLTSPGTMVAKGITTVTPIVFASVAYPEETNLIGSKLSNNLIGSRSYMAPPWQFYMFQRLYPNTKVMGFLRHRGEPDSEFLYQEFRDMLARRGITVLDLAVIDVGDIKPMLEKNVFDALYLSCDSLIQGNGSDVAVEFANAKKIPTLSCDKNSVLKGALMGFISDQYTNGLMAGRKAALILKGAEPSWLRVETPVQGYLIINEGTAKLLNLKIPTELRQRANEVVKEKQ